MDLEWKWCICVGLCIETNVTNARGLIVTEVVYECGKYYCKSEISIKN